MGFGGNLVHGFRVYAWRAVPSFPQIALCFPSLALRPQPFHIKFRNTNPPPLIKEMFLKNNFFTASLKQKLHYFSEVVLILRFSARPFWKVCHQQPSDSFKSCSWNTFSKYEPNFLHRRKFSRTLPARGVSGIYVSVQFDLARHHFRRHYGAWEHNIHRIFCMSTRCC